MWSDGWDHPPEGRWSARRSSTGTRGNKDFDNGGTAVSGCADCWTDADSFEPRDSVKGDVARMLFYMAVRYEGDDGFTDLELREPLVKAPARV